LRNYHREWDDEKQTFSMNPEHDWSSHAASAFRTLALSWRIPKVPRPNEPIVDSSAKVGHDMGAITFGAMKDQHFKHMRSLRDG